MCSRSGSGVPIKASGAPLDGVLALRSRYDAGVDIDGLRRRSDQGDRDATDQLIELAAELGDMNELRRLADAGNATATDQLIELATEVGDLDELRRLANRGNQTAADQLWELTNC
jgi:hypothetical protein